MAENCGKLAENATRSQLAFRSFNANETQCRPWEGEGGGPLQAVARSAAMISRAKEKHWPQRGLAPRAR